MAENEWKTMCQRHNAVHIVFGRWEMINFGVLAALGAHDGRSAGRWRVASSAMCNRRQAKKQLAMRRSLAHCGRMKRWHGEEEAEWTGWDERVRADRMI